MTELDQFVDQPSNHALRAAIEPWRNTFGQWSNLRDAHEPSYYKGAFINKVNYPLKAPPDILEFLPIKLPISP
jgi:hypothetical protein